jgi:hypothetical protein
MKLKDLAQAPKPGDRIAIGMDGSYSRDASSLVGCALVQPHEDTELCATYSGTIVSSLVQLMISFILVVFTIGILRTYFLSKIGASRTA